MEREEVAASILQAHIRGFLVRRKLQKVHQEYLAVVREIEGDVDLQPGKWFLSIPQFTTLGPEFNVYSHLKLSRFAGKSIESQHRANPFSAPSRNKGAPGSLQAKEMETRVPWVASERNVQPLEKHCSLSETFSCLPDCDGQKREDDLIETLGPERDLSFMPETKAEREGCFPDTVSPLRDNCATKTDAPGRDASRGAEAGAPGRDASRGAEAGAPGRDASRGAEAGAPTGEGWLEKGPLDRISNTDTKNFLPHCDTTISTFQSLHPRRDSSLWCEENVNIGVTKKTESELRKHKRHLAMEILWVQQAIVSRKNYLMVRQSLGTYD